MQINLTTLGCRLNEAELENWAQQFQSRGHTIMTDPAHADLLVVNTCAVTQEAVKKSRQLIRRTHRNNPTAKLVVSGCYASLDENMTDDIEGIDLVIHNRDKDRLADLTLQTLSFDTMGSAATAPGEAPLFARGRNRAFIKIQDGCRYRCSFCIVTVARGNERSRAVAEIIREINTIHQQGVNEIVLTGVHVGGYGSDIDSSLQQLVATILADTDIPRSRLASVEPWDLPETFLELFQNKKLMPHMHLPLQSGSDSVLKRMARRCKTTDFALLVDRLRQHIPDFNVTTDIIVGFPGETDAEWQDSLHTIEKIGFSHCHIFSYSRREGTKAATLPEQVPPAIKKQRGQELHALVRQMRRDYLHDQTGKISSVLWETKNTQGKWTGYTSNYVRVELEDDPTKELENRITQVNIIGHSAEADYLRVTLV